MSERSVKRQSQVRRFLVDTRGASIVEYALMLFLVLVVAAAAITVLGKTTRLGTDTATEKF